MKFKKIIFLWLILAGIFSCIKTNADILRLRNNYFNFKSHQLEIYSEIFMPYSEKILKKEDLVNCFCNYYFKFKSIPDIVVIFNGNKFNDAEKAFLVNYEKSLLKSGMVMYACTSSEDSSIFVNRNKLKAISEKCNVNNLVMLDIMKYTYYMRYINFMMSPLDFVKKELSFNPIFKTSINYFICKKAIGAH